MPLNQYRSSPGVGISTYFLWEDLAALSIFQRYGIAPPTEAEVAAAMQRPSNSEVDGSTQPGQDVVGAQFEGSQGRPKRRQARDQERICIAPPTKEEVAAAMQRPSGNEANNSTQTDQSAAGAQGSQGRPTQTQGSTDGMGEFSYEVSCCGFFFGCRPPSHQS
ncbi:hypothetical protein DFH29DRAFT_879377 [Suillus ampliporus]|nr:hypothetical protein DFH29DRAFT_879377 [Suillus ampliporus]